MELHQALKQIINTDGQDILTQLRVVNILSDLQAYQKMPAAKYIISSMINDGYMLKLIKIGKWNAKCEQLASQFVITTGFQEFMVSTIYQSIAFGLGWKKSIELTKAPANPPASNSKRPATAPNSPLSTELMLTHAELKKKSDSFRLDYVEKAINYLNPLIQVKGEWEKAIGLNAHASVSYDLNELSTNDLLFHLELEGVLKVFDIAIKVVIYNHKNEIVATDVEYAIKSNNSFRVVDFYPIKINTFKYVGAISRIVIYWEKF